jgi:hypothetical protein
MKISHFIEGLGLRRIIKNWKINYLNRKINSNTDVPETRFEVHFFDHFDLLDKGGMMDTDDGKGQNDDNVEYYVNDAMMHKGMIIRAKPKIAKDTKDVQDSRKRRGTTDDLDEKNQDNNSDSPTPHRTLQRAPL